ncbi:MAG: DEAD/DEAH box helicase [Clostridia bacterium]|nr:DEAD/DEAH box helicase [Clostridia bacterium]
MNFTELNLSKEILRGLEEIGFSEPTDVQAQTIPLIQQGTDVIGHSKTGTGKTAAFGLPAIQCVDVSKPDVQVLVMCPTRELAMQVCDEIRKFSRFIRGFRTVAIYGGQSIERQISALERGAQFVIGTPGRIIDHLNRKTLNLEAVKMVILDEADEMLNMGFRDDMETILRKTPRERQTLLFSATMSPDILRLTKRYQNNPEHIQIATKEKTVNEITQICYPVPRNRKNDVLYMVLKEWADSLVIIFCNTKKQVDDLTDTLKDFGVHAEGIHGDMKQAERSYVLTAFKTGKIRILVATDVAARGIDVDGIDVVINYDIPQDLEFYVHRIGRTGRAGKTGYSYTFAEGREDMYKIRDIEKFTHARINRAEMPDEETLALATMERTVEEVREILKNGARDRFYDLVDDLKEEGFAYDEIAAALAERLILPQMGKKKKKSSAIMTTLVFNIGSEMEINAGHIVAAIARNGGLPGEVIGKIRVAEKEIKADIPTLFAADVLPKLENLRIRGKRVTVTVDEA